MIPSDRTPARRAVRRECALQRLMVRFAEEGRSAAFAACRVELVEQAERRSALAAAELAGARS